MPRVNTREILAAIEDPSAELEILGCDDGRFHLLARLAGETLIHANPDGSLKCYYYAEDVFAWLRRSTGRTRATVNLVNWEPRANRGRRGQGAG